MGIGLGQGLPALFKAIGVMAVARVNLPVALLLGVSSIIVPWDTRLTSVVLYIAIPVIIAPLAEDRFSDDERIDAMLAHPILINRPIVVTPLGTKLCRPSEVVLDILPCQQKGAFAKEDGEQVVDASGKRLK
ncbi:ArsC/Spx/MgsR family protein [Aeromonas australiensis]|uniref:ArsC/Spx/MgsR family protein n=1 Tax=Aeromonas australiensis TaxID=1114880 RepID=UPI000A73E338